ncbi:putative heat shock protein family 70 protein [Podospora australis]|uniref:Heat shock protein family 70 protein n=1 Tax=Podospora australis TaxID=1536484 RepID=A0AAN7AF35_9PEZI|nr:putative heat shock protein family 70 protein [Podospora australis]
MARPTISPLSILLSAIFLFSSHVFAVSAVLGVDLGTEYIKAALVKPGIPLEIVLTKDSRRKEISAVTFKPSHNGPKKGVFPERAYGSDAMALAPRFPGDTFPNLKPLLGLPVDAAEVKEYAKRHPALQMVAHKTRGTTAFKSAGAFTPEEEAWLVEELLAMELQSIRANAEELAGKGSSVRSVVFSIPPFYTIEEKRAIELAADLAGLKVLSLISEGLAVGLNYATSRQFPNVNEGGKPEHHMVFDMGAGSTTATILKFQSRTVKDIGKFNKTVQEVQVLGSGWDRALGGDALNSLIVDDMIRQFVESPKAQKASITAESVSAHGRTIAKLTKDAERVRHVLSANQNTVASFEGLYEDVDFKYKITRAEFEEMASVYIEKVNVAIQNALNAAGLEVKDIDSVILHGGGSRTPFVQRQLESILGGSDKIRTNVNSDEAAVFGAGFRAAELSPSFRVKEIRISEAAQYPAGMRWTTDEGKPKHQRLWTANSYFGAPAKELTFTNNKEDFVVHFYQAVPSVESGSVENDIKKLVTANLTATVAELVEKHKCEKADIKLKVGVRLANENGEVDVTKVSVECEVEAAEKPGIVDGVKNLFGFGKKEQQPIKGDSETEGAEAESSSSSSSSTTKSSSAKSSSTKSASSASASASASADGKPVEKKKELIVIPVQFNVEKAGIAQLPKEDLTAIKDRLKAFQASDRARRQREEFFNQLEGYTYTIRDLIENEDFVGASTAEERATLEQKTSDASDWLYGDGADSTLAEIKERLKELQNIVQPIQKRIEEAAKRPALIKDLQEALNQTKTFVADVKKQIAEHEEFVSSLAASASASTPSSSVGSSSETTAPSSSPGDFDGLEDEEATSTTSTTSAVPTAMEDLNKERGPVPPLYVIDDLKESEQLYISISTWLEEKIVAQEKLGATDDPVLLVKDLSEKREKLDKAGMELAMKGVRNFEKRKPKASSSSSSKTKKPKATKSKASAEPKATKIKLNPGKDGKMPTQEEINEMLKDFYKENEEAQVKFQQEGVPHQEDKVVNEEKVAEEKDEL